MPPPVAVDTARIYLPSRRSKITFVVGGSIEIAIGTFLSLTVATSDGFKSNHHPSDLVVLCLIFICFFTLGFILIYGASKLSVALFPEAIQVHTLFRSTTLRFDEILGKRRKASPRSTGMHTFLIPKDKHHRKIVIKDSFGIVFDDTYTNWLASIPDLDAIDKEKRRATGKLHIWEE